MTRKKAENSFARMIVTALLAACGVMPAAQAGSQPTYDRRIEEAAIRMLQPKLGDIRGSFDLDTGGQMFAPMSRRVVDSTEPDMPAELPRGDGDGSILHF